MAVIAEPVVVGEMPRCIDECRTAHRQCQETAARLLAEGWPGDGALVLQLWDCADVCQTSASLILRNSELIGRACDTCAEACELCARECGRFVDDVRLQVCVEACRRCAASCRDVADLLRNRTAHI
jgi:hypothetical protein